MHFLDCKNPFEVKCPVLSSCLLWSSFSRVSVFVKHNNRKRKKVCSLRVSPVMQLRSLEDWGELCGSAMAAPSGEGQKLLFTPFEVLILPRRMWFSRRKSAFDSRTEIEKLSLTYFLGSECLVLSSQAVWKSLGWETDSCNQTLALRRPSWILIGVPLLDEVKRSENQASSNKRSK